MTNTKILVATADAINHAERAYNDNGWVRAPAQSKVCVELIKGEPLKVAMNIMTAWNRAYVATCNRLADEELATA